MFSRGITVAFGWEIKMGESAANRSWHKLIGTMCYAKLLITLHCSARSSGMAQSTSAKNLGSK